jgi:hypothetical protein
MVAGVFMAERDVRSAFFVFTRRVLGLPTQYAIE